MAKCVPDLTGSRQGLELLMMEEMSAPEVETPPRLPRGPLQNSSVPREGSIVPCSGFLLPRPYLEGFAHVPVRFHGFAHAFVTVTCYGPQLGHGLAG